jgi:hypothetical protein
MRPVGPLTKGWTSGTEQPGNEVMKRKLSFWPGRVRASFVKVTHEVAEPTGLSVPSTITDATPVRAFSVTNGSARFEWWDSRSACTSGD